MKNLENPVLEARAATPVHPLLAARWSPYAFDRRPVSQEDLSALFEAARWAPSSFNEQPWRFVVARREDPAEFERMLSCLVEGNRKWAGRAPVLVLGLARTIYERNGKENRAAFHDLGLATANLIVEATSRGLAVHPMGGIRADRIRELYAVPDDVRPFTALAIGFPAGEGGDVPRELRERDTRPRRRRPLAETVFGGTWGSPAL